MKTRANNMKMLDQEPLVSFAIKFRPWCWWYEVYTLVRRFLLTSLVLAFPTLQSYTVYVLSVATCALLLDREWVPHVDAYASAFNHALNAQVLLAPMVGWGGLRGGCSGISFHQLRHVHMLHTHLRFSS